jgi:sugar-specific transcriptional regulator TrmB
LDEELIKQLEEMGLTRNEAKIYLAMLGRPVYKAAEIAQAAGVPRPKVYEALTSLQNKGLCYPIPGNVAQYSAVAPKQALSDLQRRTEQELQEELARRQRLMNELVEQLLPLHSAGQTETGALRYIDLLYERTRITQVANDLLASARESVYIFEKEPYAQDPRLLNTFELAALARGVKARIIFEEGLSGLGERKDTLEKAGAEVKVISSLPMKLIVADDRAAICALRDPITGQQSLTSLRIEHPDFARAMRLLFESVWVSPHSPLLAR